MQYDLHFSIMSVGKSCYVYLRRGLSVENRLVQNVQTPVEKWKISLFRGKNRVENPVENVDNAL